MMSLVAAVRASVPYRYSWTFLWKLWSFVATAHRCNSWRCFPTSHSFGDMPTQSLGIKSLCSTHGIAEKQTNGKVTSVLCQLNQCRKVCPRLVVSCIRLCKQIAFSELPSSRWCIAGMMNGLFYSLHTAILLCFRALALSRRSCFNFIFLCRLSARILHNSFLLSSSNSFCLCWNRTMSSVRRGSMASIILLRIVCSQGYRL